MKIYCDSSFDDKLQVAGIGIVIERGGQMKKPISFWIPAPNNNYGELWAVYIAAVLSGGKECTIYSDSQTALDYVADRRGKEYENKHRQTWTREQYINHRQMQVLAYKVRHVSPNIKFVKTKAHRKVMQRESLGNRMADLMAQNGRAKFYER